MAYRKAWDPASRLSASVRRAEGMILRFFASGSTAILDNSNDDAVIIPIGFTFVFYGVAYNSLAVTSNGTISFNGVDTEPRALIYVQGPNQWRFETDWPKL